MAIADKEEREVHSLLLTPYFLLNTAIANGGMRSGYLGVRSLMSLEKKALTKGDERGAIPPLPDMVHHHPLSLHSLFDRILLTSFAIATLSSIAVFAIATLSLIASPYFLLLISYSLLK